MSALEAMARAGDRVFDRFRHRSAFGLTEAAAVDADLSSLRGHKYAVLVTFRRDGTPVPSPVWFALDYLDLAYIKTADGVGKVKRIRRDCRVLIAASTARGKPTGTAIRANARLLPQVEWPQAEQALARAYGRGRRASEFLLGSTGPVAYLEITPRDRGASSKSERA